MTDPKSEQPADSPSSGGDLSPAGNLYDFLKNEMAHRRGRRQQVFSWVSSLLVGIIGGTIALTYTKGVALSHSQMAVLIVAVLISVQLLLLLDPSPLARGSRRKNETQAVF